jgi:hypothetical protein
VAAGRCVTEGEGPAPGVAEEERDEIAGSRRFAAAAGPKEIVDRAAGEAVHPSWPRNINWSAVQAERRMWGGEGRDSGLFGEQGAPWPWP